MDAYLPTFSKYALTWQTVEVVLLFKYAFVHDGAYVALCLGVMVSVIEYPVLPLPLVLFL